MTVDRRHLLAGTAGVLAAAAATANDAAAAGPRQNGAIASRSDTSGQAFGLVPDAPHDQSKLLQAAIDAVAQQGGTLTLSPGRYRVRDIRLRPRTRLLGHGPATTLTLSAPGSLLSAERADGIHLASLALEGGGHPLSASGRAGLVTITGGTHLSISAVEVRASLAYGISLDGVSGHVRDCIIFGAIEAGLISVDARGLEITHNRVTDCTNNGILVWRSRQGEDGTIVANNRIERIAAARGGSGQYGNGINVYRAGNVLVTGNRIADCAYTAIRGNAASGIQMVANNCSRLGEVALYAEFGFEGALIASNLVDGAATGISVTNFNEGGRLAVVQGNLLRNLVRREHEPDDKRGEGIAVEADAVVSGNTIEAAATVGIMVGWGRYMRDVAVTSNVIRSARTGIMITRDPDAGACMIAQNLVSGARDGAIRLMDKGIGIGPDLAEVPSPSPRLLIAGNLATPPAA